MKEYFILAVICSLCVAASARCPFNDEEEWKEFQGFCYYFSKTTHSWTSAEYFCRRDRDESHLADIYSDEENEWIHQRLNGFRYSKNYYIGATDAEEEGVFRWDITREILSYSNWADGEPNQWMGDPENCVEIKTDSGEWNDVPCYLSKRVICKRAAVSNSP